MSNQDDTQPDWMLDKDGLHRLNESNRPRFPNAYLGWPNYETWCVNAWLTTEPDCYERLMSIVQSCDTLGDQAEAIRQWVSPNQGNNDEPGITGIYCDLLASAFDMVQWREIVRTNSEDN